MCLAVYLHQITGVHVGVALRGRQAGMPQKLLNRTEIRTTLKEVRGEAVPQAVGADMLRDGCLSDSTRNE